MTISPQPPIEHTEPSGHSGHSHPAPGAGHGHSHSHSHGPAAPVSKHLRKVIAAVLIPFAAAVVIGLMVLWPGGAPARERSGWASTGRPSRAR